MLENCTTFAFHSFIKQFKKQKKMATFKGKLEFVNPIEERGTTEKKFKSQTLCVTSEDEVNGQVYTNSLMFQAGERKFDDIKELNLGDEVEVTYATVGNLYTKKDVEGTLKNPNCLNCIVNLNLISITVLKKYEAPFSL